MMMLAVPGFVIRRRVDESHIGQVNFIAYIGVFIRRFRLLGLQAQRWRIFALLWVATDE